MSARFVLFAVLAAFSWLMLQRLREGDRWALVATAALAGVLLTGLEARTFWRFAPLVAEYVSALDRVPPGATLLALSAADRGTTGDTTRETADARPLLHAAGHVGDGQRDIALLNHYQSGRTHFPIGFRDPRLTAVGAFDKFPFEPVSIARYEAQTARVVDCVLVWGPPALPGAAGQHLAAVREELARGFVLVHRSSPTTFASVWCRPGRVAR